MAANMDPYDIEALETSVNDSAVRVSTIWVSFLLFGLYLAIAAGGVTHLQLLLDEPIRLPVLSVDLPLVGFFYVAPALFVIFHVYVLVQVQLLYRTAVAYNEAVEHSILDASDRARVRQRLANTLFAQIFAGSPREREGLLGVLLRLMARATLAIGPVAVLLFFEVKSLPYQDVFVTFTHRVLIAVDLCMVLVLWRGVIQSPRDIKWRRVAGHSAALFLAIVVVLFSWLVVQFPGPYANWMRLSGGPYESAARAGCGPLIFPDRLELPLVNVVDREKLAKIESTAKVKGLSAYQGERTRNFRNRRFRCANFDRADFRSVDFSESDLRGANLAHAELQGAILSSTNLRDANLEGAQMQGADLSSWRGRWAPRVLRYGDGADLRGAWLLNAQLQGARLNQADMSGAILHGAQLQGASLYFASLQGANLGGAQMQGADLGRARMQVTDLRRAQMKGANVTQAHLEGARLHDSSLTLAQVRHAFLWRARGAKCDDAQVTEPQLDLIVGQPSVLGDERKAAVDEEPDEIDNLFGFLEKEELRKELRKRLIADAEHDDATRDVWLACEMQALTQGEYESKHAEYLIELACEATHSQKYLAFGIYSNWIEEPDESLKDRSSGPLSDAHRLAVVRGLLGLDGKKCPGANELGERAIKRLQDLAVSNLRN
jgi:uncharacterized protein YjbI with pentapeptide repeats